MQVNIPYMDGMGNGVLPLIWDTTPTMLDKAHMKQAVAHVPWSRLSRFVGDGKLIPPLMTESL